MTTLRGVFTALITPFSSDGRRVDLDRLTEQINHQADGGVTGVVPCGTTGETPTLTDDEQRAVIERTVSVGHARGLVVMAGAGSNDTRHAVAMHRSAADAGADAALHVTPYYNRPSPEGLEAHFTAIADSCDLPVVLYHVPGRTGVTMTAETIRRLARHEHIVAIKEASGSFTLASELVATTDLVLLNGDDPITLPMAAIGAIGVVSVLSNLLPERVTALWRAIEADDTDRARKLHDALLPLARRLLGPEPNPVPVKRAMELLGRDCGAVRLPMVPAGRETTEALRDLLAPHRHGSLSAPAVSAP